MTDQQIKIADLRAAIIKHFHVSSALLNSPLRARRVVRPRQVAMYLAKQLTGRSLPEIGRQFGNRDHTTVLHAVRKIEELSGKDPELRADIEYLRARLQLQTPANGEQIAKLFC